MTSPLNGFQQGAVVNTQGFGNRPENVEIPFITNRAPTAQDTGQGFFPIGKRWLDTVAGSEYVLTSFTTSVGVITANWAFLGSSSGDLNSLTTQDLTVVTPTAGTIIFNGNNTQGLSTTGSNAPGTVNITAADWTTSQKGVGVLSTNAQAVTGTGTTQAVTPAALTARLQAPGAIGGTTPGSGAFTTVSATSTITAGTTLTATLGNITATNGNIVRGTAGNKDIYSSVATTTTAGANSAGTVALSGGTATVSTTAVTASSQIRLYRQGIGATGAAALGILTLGTVTAGTSFVIRAVQAADATALQATDVSVIGWEIVN